ncbi:MAG: hypothetical protein ACRC1H_14485 [Caldilineaceae bacterium]
MSSRRLLLYMLVLAVILFALRPKESWRNLRDLYTQRRWVVTTVAVIILIYFALGLLEAWRSGQLWAWSG